VYIHIGSHELYVSLISRERVIVGISTYDGPIRRSELPRAPTTTTRALPRSTNNHVAATCPEVPMITTQRLAQKHQLPPRRRHCQPEPTHREHHPIDQRLTPQCANLGMAEMVTYLPISSPFIRFAGRYVDEAFGVAAGYNFFVFEAALVPFEIVACNVIIHYWSDIVPAGGVIAIVIVLYG